MNKEERAAALTEACDGDINPVKIATKIIEDPDGYSPIEIWLASNYLGAISLIETKKLIKESEEFLNEVIAIKNPPLTNGDVELAMKTIELIAKRIINGGISSENSIKLTPVVRELVEAISIG